jgi:alpha-maltose-1-phosphate synthase
MIVAMITQEYPPYLLGGAATHVQELSRGLARAGHTVHVFSYSTERTFTLQDQGVCVHFLQFPLAGREHQYDGNLRELESLGRMLADHATRFFENSQAPDIIHAHEWLEFPCAEILRKVFDVPVIVTNHMVWAWMLETLMPHPESGQIIERERDSCRQADKVIAVSRSIKEQIVARYGAVESQVDVVLNGLNPDIFDPENLRQEEIAEEREQLGLNGGDKLVLYAGRLTSQKGVSALLRSALQVLRKRDDVRYAIAGKLEPGGYSDILTKMVVGHPKLKSRVMFLDRVSRERLAVLYGVATLVVVPSVYEPFGYAAVEAMAAGKPVIASNTGGLAEIIEDEKSGLLVPLVAMNAGAGIYDVDVPKLTSAQLRICDDPKMARLLGKNARERALSLFSVERMIEGVLETYRNAIEAKVLRVRSADRAVGSAV